MKTFLFPLVISLCFFTNSISKADFEIDPTQFFLPSYPDNQKAALKTLLNDNIQGKAYDHKPIIKETLGEIFGGPYRLRDKSKDWHIGLLMHHISPAHKPGWPLKAINEDYFADDYCYLVHKPAEHLHAISAPSFSQPVDCYTAELLRATAWVVSPSQINVSLDGKKQLKEISQKKWVFEKTIGKIKYAQSLKLDFDSFLKNFSFTSAVEWSSTAASYNAITLEKRRLKVHEISERPGESGRNYFRIWVSSIQTFNPLKEYSEFIILGKEILEATSREDLKKLLHESLIKGIRSFEIGVETRAPFQYFTLEYAPEQKKLVVKTYMILQEEPTATLVYSEAP